MLQGKVLLVCLFVLSINHHWPSGHGYLKPVSRLKMCPRVNYTSRMLMGGRKETWKKRLQFLDLYQQQETHPVVLGITEDYKTGQKGYHKTFMILKILTHNKSRKCINKQRIQQGGLFGSYFTRMMYKTPKTEIHVYKVLSPQLGV